jgi:hypothetical protein
MKGDDIFVLASIHPVRPSLNGPEPVRVGFRFSPSTPETVVVSKAVSHAQRWIHTDRLSSLLSRVEWPPRRF